MLSDCSLQIYWKQFLLLMKYRNTYGRWWLTPTISWWTFQRLPWIIFYTIEHNSGIDIQKLIKQIPWKLQSGFQFVTDTATGMSTSHVSLFALKHTPQINTDDTPVFLLCGRNLFAPLDLVLKPSVNLPLDSISDYKSTLQHSLKTAYPFDNDNHKT